MSTLDITITFVDVLVLVPALSVITDIPLQNKLISDVKLRLRNSDWGDRANMAATYLAAHIGAISLRKANAAVGPVSDISVDDVSRSWATPAEVNTYTSTNWGMMYMQLRDSIFKLNGTLLSRFCPPWGVGGW